MPRRAAEPLVKIAPRFRVLFREEIALGPGKVELLKAIQEMGSIRQAASRLRMSYMRAWLLIRTMNRCFKSPLVHSERGGASKGGAKLTDTGKAAVRLYEQLETESLATSRKTCEELMFLLREK
ncbi:MAG TPA: LysR family transcriptional regulator [Verrucomicrobiae bacterium]|jgi:molybdate transport system regulatory protein|nr:LysR family transcriptional regulator [Verrucomicrobiae bacterium]